MLKKHIFFMEAHIIEKSDTLVLRRDLASSDTKKRHWPKKKVEDRLVPLGLLKNVMSHGF